jgi:6-phosphofructokinase 2
MIITVTMNPAIDKSTTVAKLIAEKKLRCPSIEIEAGGGGINVSKALKELGGESMAIFPCGGSNGKLLEKILGEQNINFRTVPIVSETREDFTVTELATNSQYRFVMPGCVLTNDEVEFCLDLVSSLHPAPAFIVASGSLPQGVPDNFFARLAAISKRLGAKCIIDTSGQPLTLAAQEGVYLLKPNLAELCSLSGRDYLQLDEIENAALQVIKKGHCEVMVVSMGAAGAMLVTNKMFERIQVPIVKKVSTVGAGDSMVAGMARMLEQKKSLNEMIRFGVACGTAATMNPGTQLFKKEDVLKLYEWINKVN